MTDRNKMHRVLELARFMDVADPDPSHIFDARSAVINVWATPNNHPGGEWSAFVDQMTSGVYSKPAEYVGSVGWTWGDVIHALEVHTDPDWLADKLKVKSADLVNNPKDVEWVRAQIRELFGLAGVECPPFVVRGK